MPSRRAARRDRGNERPAGFGGAFTFSATDHNGLTAEDLALYRVRAAHGFPPSDGHASRLVTGL